MATPDLDALDDFGRRGFQHRTVSANAVPSPLTSGACSVFALALPQPLSERGVAVALAHPGHADKKPRLTGDQARLVLAIERRGPMSCFEVAAVLQIAMARARGLCSHGVTDRYLVRQRAVDDRGALFALAGDAVARTKGEWDYRQRN